MNFLHVSRFKTDQILESSATASACFKNHVGCTIQPWWYARTVTKHIERLCTSIETILFAKCFIRAKSRENEHLYIGCKGWSSEIKRFLLNTLILMNSIAFLWILNLLLMNTGLLLACRRQDVGLVRPPSFAVVFCRLFPGFWSSTSASVQSLLQYCIPLKLVFHF